MDASKWSRRGWPAGAAAPSRCQDAASRTLVPEMVTRPLWPAGWTRRHLRHVAGIFWRGRNPAARVYESIGSDFFLAPAPGWLNLGLWEGLGSEDEAGTACRRLVQTVAAALPEAGVILDVGNGLGTQDPVIAEALHPHRLIAVNITEWQLSAGRDRLGEAAALGVAGDDAAAHS
jgi:hypothetical protein